MAVHQSFSRPSIGYKTNPMNYLMKVRKVIDEDGKETFFIPEAVMGDDPELLGRLHNQLKKEYKQPHYLGAISWKEKDIPLNIILEVAKSYDDGMFAGTEDAIIYRGYILHRDKNRTELHPFVLEKDYAHDIKYQHYLDHLDRELTHEWMEWQNAKYDFSSPVDPANKSLIGHPKHRSEEPYYRPLDDMFCEVYKMGMADNREQAVEILSFTPSILVDGEEWEINELKLNKTMVSAKIQCGDQKKNIRLRGDKYGPEFSFQKHQQSLSERSAEFARSRPEREAKHRANFERLRDKRAERLRKLHGAGRRRDPSELEQNRDVDHRGLNADHGETEHAERIKQNTRKDDTGVGEHTRASEDQQFWDSRINDEIPVEIPASDTPDYDRTLFVHSDLANLGGRSTEKREYSVTEQPERNVSNHHESLISVKESRLPVYDRSPGRIHTAQDRKQLLNDQDSGWKIRPFGSDGSRNLPTLTRRRKIEIQNETDRSTIFRGIRKAVNGITATIRSVAGAIRDSAGAIGRVDEDAKKYQQDFAYFAKILFGHSPSAEQTQRDYSGSRAAENSFQRRTEGASAGASGLKKLFVPRKRDTTTLLNHRSILSRLQNFVTAPEPQDDWYEEIKVSNPDWDPVQVSYDPEQKKDPIETPTPLDLPEPTSDDPEPPAPEQIPDEPSGPTMEM